MEKQYEYIGHMAELYNLLQDERSKKLFEARLAYDLEQSLENAVRIVIQGEEWQYVDAQIDSISTMNYKKLVLYGTNLTGRALAGVLLKKQIDFYGFCGRKAKEFPDGLMGKPVISPDELFQNANDFYVLLAVKKCHDEIVNILNENGFPQDHILASLPLKWNQEVDCQYFEFPSLFPRGTAFVDGGCLDCRTSFLFADWCGGGYTKIFAFEPDPISYAQCEQILSNSNVRNIHMIQAGLSDHDGKVTFQANLHGCSHVTEDGNTGGNMINGGSHIVKGSDMDEQLIAIPITTIDNVVGEEKIGFIKLDIEGSEFDALHGAKKVIVRDKPLLAICVYHRVGDTFAIMDYLHELVPEYHFWLRHYSLEADETVLYASTDVLNK